LNLRRCSGLTEAGLGAILERCSNLQILYLGYNEWVSDATVKLIARNCPNVQKLDLFGCGEIKDEDGIGVLLEHCSNLCLLNIAFTKISADGKLFAAYC
jgi:hypothetical protein